MTDTYYMMTLNYLELGDKYLITLQDMSTKKILCRKQEMPREYAIQGIAVDDLEDPDDVMRSLRARLEAQLRLEAHEIRQIAEDKIDKSFF